MILFPSGYPTSYRYVPILCAEALGEEGEEVQLSRTMKNFQVIELMVCLLTRIEFHL